MPPKKTGGKMKAGDASQVPEEKVFTTRSARAGLQVRYPRSLPELCILIIDALTVPGRTYPSLLEAQDTKPDAGGSESGCLYVCHPGVSHR